MRELVLLFTIGCCLSIDAFSISTVVGLYNLSIKKTLKVSLIVGLFHFIMPLLGFILSNYLLQIISIDTNLILGIILIFISTQMLIEYINPSKKDLSLNFLGIVLFALGVSLDSFSVGLGLDAITTNLLLSSTIFSLCSFTFTFIGLTIGKYVNKLFSKYSYLVGTIILFLLGLCFICKSF